MPSAMGSPRRRSGVEGRGGRAGGPGPGSLAAPSVQQQPRVGVRTPCSPQALLEAARGLAGRFLEQSREAPSRNSSILVSARSRCPRWPVTSVPASPAGGDGDRKPPVPVFDVLPGVSAAGPVAFCPQLRAAQRVLVSRVWLKKLS